MALKSMLWKLISAGKQLTLINTDFVSANNYFMQLLDVVESTGLQIQFVAIKSLLNQTAPNWMDSCRMLWGTPTPSKGTREVRIAVAHWKFISNNWIQKKEWLCNAFMKMYS